MIKVLSIILCGAIALNCIVYKILDSKTLSPGVEAQFLIEKSHIKNNGLTFDEMPNFIFPTNTFLYLFRDGIARDFRKMEFAFFAPDGDVLFAGQNVFDNINNIYDLSDKKVIKKLKFLSEYYYGNNSMSLSLTLNPLPRIKSNEITKAKKLKLKSIIKRL